MKRLLLIFAVTLSFQSFAQIKFVDKETSWEQLSKKAKKEKKLIFIQLESGVCERCNEMASKAFDDPSLTATYGSNFVAIRNYVESDNGKMLAEKFKAQAPLSAIYTDPEGNILYRFNGSTSDPKVYLNSANTAISRRAGKQLGDYEKEYKKGAMSARFLKEYIQKRQYAFLPTSHLLDEYVGKLPLDSLDYPDVVRFIYQQGPSVDSRAYKVIQTVVPRQRIDSMYKGVPYSEAVAFNRNIFLNSIKRAEETKNSQLAYQAANFLQQSYMPDHVTGRIYFQRTMVNYYFLVKDTVRYFSECQQLLDYHHMISTVDSLKRMDAAMQKRNISWQEVAGHTAEELGTQGAPPSALMHMELNNNAWQYYQLTNNPRQLERALMWSKRSMEWFQELHADPGMPFGNPAYIDTYAHLLYKLGRSKEGIEWQTKAVEAQKVSGMPWESMEKDLEAMKTGTLK